ncbi:MAG: hypothetical protein ACKV2T_35650 [Kofleriaceae bacterium]
MRGLVAATAVAALAITSGCKKGPPRSSLRDTLWAELRPVALENCTIERVGSANDGGYLMCTNLVEGAVSAYSYGIEYEDNWGCQLATKWRIPIHQYDCFTNDRPTCAGGTFVFHDECVGGRTETLENQPFDTFANQVAKNGDAGKRIIVKMDVEGAEWETFLATPDEVLAKIDQLPMELHGVGEQRHIDLVRKLKKTFHLVSIHFNNYACGGKKRRFHPFPADAYQVLWVNKRLGVLDAARPGRVPGSPPDAKDAADKPDCQPAP